MDGPNSVSNDLIGPYFQYSYPLKFLRIRSNIRDSVVYAILRLLAKA